MTCSSALEMGRIGPEIGQPGFGSWLMGGGQDPYPSKWLRDQLAKNYPRSSGIRRRRSPRNWPSGMSCSPQLSRLEEEEIQLARGVTGKPSELLKLYRAEIDLPDPIRPAGRLCRHCHQLRCHLAEVNFTTEGKRDSPQRTQRARRRRPR